MSFSDNLEVLDDPVELLGAKQLALNVTRNKSPVCADREHTDPAIIEATKAVLMLIQFLFSNGLRTCSLIGFPPGKRTMLAR